jgi:hypothetical protein
LFHAAEIQSLGIKRCSHKSMTPNSPQRSSRSRWTNSTACPCSTRRCVGVCACVCVLSLCSSTLTHSLTHTSAFCVLFVTHTLTQTQPQKKESAEENQKMDAQLADQEFKRLYQVCVCVLSLCSSIFPFVPPFLPHTHTHHTVIYFPLIFIVFSRPDMQTHMHTHTNHIRTNAY